MSTLSSISNYLGREQQLLRELNNALIALEAEALGHGADFGLTPKEISESRQKLLDFVVRLGAAIDQETSSIDLQAVVNRLKSGIKPVEDWKEDLNIIAKDLQTKGQLPSSRLPILESILSLLDSEFTEDLKHLYAR